MNANGAARFKATLGRQLPLADGPLSAKFSRFACANMLPSVRPHIPCPFEHELAAAIEEVGSSVSRLNSIDELVSEDLVDNFLRVPGSFSGPIGKAAAESVNGGLVKSEVPQDLGHCHVAERLHATSGKD